MEFQGRGASQTTTPSEHSACRRRAGGVPRLARGARQDEPHHPHPSTHPNAQLPAASWAALTLATSTGAWAGGGDGG